MKYTVGQVLYVIPAKQATVYPMQIIEEVTKRTLSGGIETLYMVQGGPGSKGATRLDEISGEIFDSAELVYKTLIERVTQQISKMVESAVKKSDEWYKHPAQATQAPSLPVPVIPAMLSQAIGMPVLKKQPTDVSDVAESSDKTVVDLGGGMVARVRLPDQLK